VKSKMIEIDLQMPTRNFSPGDSVAGIIVISSDPDIRFNRIYAILRGEESTRFIRGSRKHRRFYEEKRTHVEELLNLPGHGSIGLQKEAIPFHFVLPDSCPGSYYGTHGWIRYRIEAFLEISPTDESHTAGDIFVFAPSPAPPLQSMTTSITEKDIDILKVELSENGFVLGEDFDIRVWVASLANIRGVKAEILHREYVISENHIEDTRRSFSRWYARKEDIQTDTWSDVKLQSSHGWPLSFKTDLIKSQYILKVTLDIPWRFDKSVEMPIFANA